MRVAVLVATLFLCFGLYFRTNVVKREIYRVSLQPTKSFVIDISISLLSSDLYYVVTLYLSTLFYNINI